MKIYYGLIFVISFIALVIMPLFSSDADIGFNFPKSPAGWLFWGVTRAIISGLNVLLFHCFVKQGDLNTQDNKDRVEAEKRLAISTKKEYIPQSPKEFFRKEYVHKVPKLLLGTALSLVALGPVILRYDFATFLTYVTVVLGGVIFGVLEMRKVETYYTKELPKYVDYLDSLKSKEQEENVKN